MSWVAPTVLFGWIPFVVVLFGMLPARRAALVGYFGAWLFLPLLEFPVAGLPNVSKVSVTTYSVLLGVLLTDAGRLSRLRLRWWDLPALAWCLVPLPVAILNGYGVYDGVSAVVSAFILWGFPYLVGRMYFDSSEAMRDLLLAFVIGGIVYAPLVLIEARLSPQLHLWVYGFRQEQDFLTTRRLGGWRPMVFMQHGLAVGLFMAVSAIAAIGARLWSVSRSVLHIPITGTVLLLLPVAVLCRSAYALALLLLAACVLLVARHKPSRRVVVLVGWIPLAYMLARTVGGWDASELVDASRLFGGERASSLELRLTSESNLWRVAQDRPIFGYGRWIWGTVSPYGGPMIPDGMWIIALGRTGLVGLASITLMFLLPGWVLVTRLKGVDLRSPGAGVWLTVLVIPSIYVMDNLLNAMVNPLFVLAAGGIAGGAESLRRRAVPRPAAAGGEGWNGARP